MNKKQIFGLLSVVFILVLSFWFYTNFLLTEPSMKKQITKHRISAIDLYAQFDQNEAAANNKFLNKVLEVKGMIKSIDQNEQSKPVIMLETEGFGFINATLSDAKELDTLVLQNGNEVTLKGECIGLLLDVLLINAIILND